MQPHPIRGAEIENILKFDKDFPDAKVYKLERNYRSTKAILQLANASIAHNRNRKGKTLWTDGDDGVKIVYKSCYDEKYEADYVLYFQYPKYLVSATLFFPRTLR